ncbi:MAG TPA: cytochrome c biogenesis protein CcdA [Candidatus Gracilibacteria bacterium]|nr:cytochrome c biogenesis protein CcdA [Candidatus Gracilibacteria bacterium]
MKKLLILLTPIFAIAILSTSIAFAQSGKAVLYYGNGCPHCAKVEEFIQNNTLNIEIEKKEIYQNKENAQEFNDICDKEGINLMDRGVPFLYVKGKNLIGDKPIISYLESLKTVTQKEPLTDPVKHTNGISQSLTLPILAGAAIVDSINPCEFAVLLILMTTLLASGNRKRALWSGLAYSASIFISYFFMGIGLYSIISNIGTTSIFMKVIGVIAILLGIFNLKDFFWYGKFFVMEVPMKWRPKLKALVRSITGPISAFLIGILVSLFLLPCTSGPYIVILGMLGHSETYTNAVLLLLLYNLIFILPMLGITIAVYFGMNVEKAEETRSKNLKFLHLIAGIIMLVMGIVLVSGIF